MEEVIGIAQYGTKHAHATGKARALASSSDVTFAGIFEPDPKQRARMQRSSAYASVRWYDSAAELFGDASVGGVAVEGDNAESLAMAREALDAGRHVWLDKPAGDDWETFRRLVSDARERRLLVQLGYMYRYHDGFNRIADWAKSGILGDIFAIRAHMSTSIPDASRREIRRFKGGIFYELAGHMLDQVVWILGRPQRVTAFLRNDATPSIPDFLDNTLGVFEYERAMAYIDVAAMEAKPNARRYEVYGTRGSAIIEPFETAKSIRLCLEAPHAGFEAGEQHVPVAETPRAVTYARELAAFIAAIRGTQPPTRSLDHELAVQETLLRATGRIAVGSERR